MGNIFSLSQCCGSKTRPVSIFGKPKKNLGRHTTQPLIRISRNVSSTNQIVQITYPTTPPYFIGDLTM
jgi:hypothetical protein